MKTIVVAPHPDDEVMGVGGTILRRKAEGAEVAWLIVTGLTSEAGWNQVAIKRRSEEIKRVAEIFSFDSIFELNIPTTQLDRIPMGTLISEISNVFKIFVPEEVFVPHPSDIHTDHRMVFNAVASCTKWFRYPSIRRVMAYETLSETDFNLGVGQSFKPNVFINIDSYLEDKLRALNVYSSEIAEFPFPRSHEAVRALAAVRGAASGFEAAEAFQLLRERV